MVVVFGEATILRTSVQWKFLGTSPPWVAVGFYLVGYLTFLRTDVYDWGDSLA